MIPSAVPSVRPSFLTYVTTADLAPLPSHFAMGSPNLRLLYDFSGGDYDRTSPNLSFLGRAREPRMGACQIINLATPWWDGEKIRCNSATQYTPGGELIHSNVHLLLLLINDAGLDPSPIGLHDRSRRESLEQFFKQVLDYSTLGDGNGHG